MSRSSIDYINMAKENLEFAIHKFYHGYYEYEKYDIEQAIKELNNALKYVKKEIEIKKSISIKNK